jgi:outer membrane protein assembly factor BamB
MAADTIFVGIKGTVLALDRATGTTQWRTELKGSEFVNVMQQDGDLFAACRGRLYRLDPVTGAVQWCNELPGLGWGIVSISGAAQTPASAEKKRRDEQRAAASAGS